MLYLIRHCSTLENETGILCSNKDSELSKKGILQANKLSNWLLDKNIGLILTSDLLRATQTSNIIGAATNSQIKEFSELRERSIGNIYENMSKPDLLNFRTKQNHNFFDLSQDWNNINEVESDEMVFKRTQTIFQRYNKESKNFACVTHAGVIKAFLYSVFQIEKARSNAFKVRNGCVLVFQNENNFEHIQLTGMYQL